jgi:hypothetical protein
VLLAEDELGVLCAVFALLWDGVEVCAYALTATDREENKTIMLSDFMVVLRGNF